MISNCNILKKALKIVVLLVVGASFGKGIVGKTLNKSESSKLFLTEDALIKEAWNTIQKCLKLEQASSPYFISCTYKMSGCTKNASAWLPIQAVVKVYYTDYHKVPSSFEKKFVEDETVKTDKVIEVVYKPADKNHLSLIEKDPSALYKKLETREINVPTSIILA